MSSIRSEQIARTVEDITRGLYSTGVKPTLNDILTQVSMYFSQYPAGLPLSLPMNYISKGSISDVDKFNLILAHLSLNLDVLYTVSLQQVDEILQLTSALAADLELLSSRRSRLAGVVDDYLLSQYNTDGYYFSLSDGFADLSLTDLGMTTAYVDTVLHHVTLPIISSLSNRLSGSFIGMPQIQIADNAGSVSKPNATFAQISPWSGAVNGLGNSVWEIQVETDAVGEVVCVLTIPLGNDSKTVTLSRVDLDPYGIVPVQAFMELGTTNNTTDGSLGYQEFGGKIQTSQSKMSFIDNSIQAVSLRITLRKTQNDYVDTSSGTTKYKYIFGIKNLVIQEQVFDNSATFVSGGLALPADLQKSYVIDAVSLVVDSNTPADTNAEFFVASEPFGGGLTLGDFQWKSITPLGEDTNTSTQVVHFNGALVNEVLIRSKPQSSTDLQLIAPDNANTDPTLNNPSAVIIPGVDIWRIASFTDSFIQGTLSLAEGINTTRIYSAPYDPAAVKSFTWWAKGVSEGTYTVNYGRIDTGNEFFYGGDIGENFRSCYVETYINCDATLETPLQLTCQKSDPNSKTWSVRVFLNDQELGYLPGNNADTTGNPVDQLILPWAFQQGLNHVGVLINIPGPSTLIPNPYIGTLDLMGGKDLFDYGTVELAAWTYLDFFALQANQIGTPTTFSLSPSNELVSRRQPTDNFRISYQKNTANGPTDIRLRMDMSRDNSNTAVTPALNSYRLRFAYGAPTQG